MASGQGVRLCIMGGYSFSEVCIPELYYIICPFRASYQGLTLFVMAINKIIGVFSLQKWLFRFLSAWPGRLLSRNQGIWTLRAQKSTSQNAYSVLRYPKFLCNIHFERYAICLYNFPSTDFVTPNVYAIWGVMHYESDAKREVWLYMKNVFSASYVHAPQVTSFLSPSLPDSSSDSSASDCKSFAERELDPFGSWSSACGTFWGWKTDRSLVV